MNFFSIYDKKLEENKDKIRCFQDYLKGLNDVQFNLYSDKLTVPVLVPIGSRIVFRGALKHTNEVMTTLGAGYFVKCSTEQAEILKQHRIKDVQSKLDIALKEKAYLERQIKLKKSVLDVTQKEIIELESYEEDKAWREKHRKTVKEYNQSKNKKEELNKNDISDESLWKRLEELELQEELENAQSEANSNKERPKKKRNKKKKENIENAGNWRQYCYEKEMSETGATKKCSKIKPGPETEIIVTDKKELEKKIRELSNRKRNATKTESDLMSRLDELEQLEEAEDEMYRLDDLIYEEDVNDEEENENKNNTKRSVSFVVDNERETLQLTFRHSKVEPCKELYNPQKGILKPSDIYDAFSNLPTEPTPILKKTNNESKLNEPEKDQLQNENPNRNVKNVQAANIFIVVNDIKEKASTKQKILDSGQRRPMSIFKKRRQHKS